MVANLDRTYDLRRQENSITARRLRRRRQRLGSQAARLRRLEVFLAARQILPNPAAARAVSSTPGTMLREARLARLYGPAGLLPRKPPGRGHKVDIGAAVLLALQRADELVTHGKSRRQALAEIAADASMPTVVLFRIAGL